MDYLKYDWYPNDIPHVKEMSDALRNCGRDVVFSLSNSAPYDLAGGIAQLTTAWRTTEDIRDTWESMSRLGFSQDRWAGYTCPGHWADPDMLVVGKVGWGPSLHPTKLTHDEQLTHISLWCLLSAPLLIGCDIAQMDDFTVGLLTNDEVLELDQDALGKQATQVRNERDQVIYTKALEDGSTAVGLFNRGETETTITLKWGPWKDIPLADKAKFMVRDLWQRKDMGVFEGKYEVKVAPHGVVLLKLSAPQ